MDKEHLWQAVLGELELLISRASFMTWFKNTYISSIAENGEVVTIAVPNVFTQTWLEQKYHKLILNSLRNLTDNRVKKIIYKVETNPIRPRLSLEVLKEKIDKHGLNSRYTFERFVVGKGNELAQAAAKAVAEKPGKKYNPLFIYGGVGLGKTHLLHAIGNEILSKNPKIKLLCINAEKFTNEFVKSIREGTMEEFRKKYREPQIFLVDDIQFLAGKEATQEEFFHTFNNLYATESQIVITSDRPPKAISTLEERLISRFEWGLIADISPPDFETRFAILKTKSQEVGYNFSEEILRYIAAHAQNNVRELEGALNKIIAYHELHGMPITLEMVKSFLKKLTSQPRRGTIQIKHILSAVADFYGMEVKDLVSNSRKREVVTPRQVAIYLMREELNASFPLMAKELGGRDHTTIIYSYHKIKREVDLDERIKQEIDLIKQRLYNE